MPFTNSIHNEDLLTPSADFIEAKSLISAGRGWKKWPRLISKSAYERVCTDARNCLETIGVREKAIGHFLHETIDHYLEYGTLKPKYMQFMYELGLFVIFKRMIDEAISRRVKAIKAAALRKARKAAEKGVDADCGSNILTDVAPMSCPADEAGEAATEVDSESMTLLTETFHGIPLHVCPDVDGCDHEAIHHRLQSCSQGINPSAHSLSTG